MDQGVAWVRSPTSMGTTNKTLTRMICPGAHFLSYSFSMAYSHRILFRNASTRIST
jgi:hypothetical protein